MAAELEDKLVGSSVSLRDSTERLVEEKYTFFIKASVELGALFSRQLQQLTQGSHHLLDVFRPAVTSLELNLIPGSDATPE